MNDDSKECENCRKVFTRRKISRCQFRRRLYCSVQCGVDARITRIYGFNLGRVRRVLAYDPTIELWQLCERFGVDEVTASGWKTRFARTRPLP